MLIAKNINQYNDNYIYFCDPIKNNIMYEGTFNRILYSTPYFSLNGVYLNIQFNYCFNETAGNKNKCSYDVKTNIMVINEIKKIETNILEKYSNKTKMPQYKLYEQLMCGTIKLHIKHNAQMQTPSPTHNNNFILKISGIWETVNCYGLTYKFIKMDTLPVSNIQ
jgi:hypothetical protein